MVTPDQASPSRRRAARLIREVGDAFVEHHLDDRGLDLFSATLQVALSMLTEAEPAQRRSEAGRVIATAPADGERLDHGDQCFVSGDASPIGIVARPRRSGDEAVTTLRFRRTYEGRPGHAHSGAVAAALDDTLDLVVGGLHRTSARTARLQVEHLRPIPVERDVELRARVEQVRERQWTVSASASIDGVLHAKASGLMVEHDKKAN